MPVVAVAARELALPLPLEAARHYCEALEAGAILDLGPSPVEFSADELALLRGQQTSGGAHHKNIAYRPRRHRLSGLTSSDPERMRALMRRFSHDALAFLRGFLSPYQLEADYASFRPLEEAGRVAKLHARNDLLHVDSFPTRPSRGRRILRFFVNVHGVEPRVWKTGPSFGELARDMASASGLLARYRRERQRSAVRRALVEVLARCGLAHQFRPPYDRFMLSFHDWLKANEAFQAEPHTVQEFRPMSSWMCMTDTVSHAVLRGRQALEQTVWVRPETLQAPGCAPEHVLEELAAAQAPSGAASGR